MYYNCATVNSHPVAQVPDNPPHIISDWLQPVIPQMKGQFIFLNTPVFQSTRDCICVTSSNHYKVKWHLWEFSTQSIICTDKSSSFRSIKMGLCLFWILQFLETLLWDLHKSAFSEKLMEEYSQMQQEYKAARSKTPTHHKTPYHHIIFILNSYINTYQQISCPSSGLDPTPGECDLWLGGQPLSELVSYCWWRKPAHFQI